MKIAILGWGSLLWEGGTEFDRWHTGWAYDGPVLRIEFSRISATRLGALTLVIDNEHGAPTAVAWCLSERTTLEEAVFDLQVREDTTPDQIGRVITPSEVKAPADVLIRDPIETWTRANKFDAAIWTALKSNFKEKTKQTFSVSAAVAHLKSLLPEAKVKAAEYIWRAPNFVKTPVRAAIQVEPWFKSAVITQSVHTKPILEVSDRIAIALTLLSAIILFFEDKTPVAVATLLGVAFLCGLYVLRHLVARLPWVAGTKGNTKWQFLSSLIVVGIIWATAIGWYGVRKWPKREILVVLTFKDSSIFTQQRRKNIEIELDDYYRYLRNLGFDLPREIPPIGASPPHAVGGAGGGGGGLQGPVYYSSLIIPEDALDAPGSVRTTYSLYVFDRILVWPDAWKSNLPHAEAEDDEVAAWIYSCYFPRSFGGQSTCDNSAPGHQWVDAMWDVRQKYGQEYADSLMCYALKMWRDLPTKYADNFDRFFRYKLVTGETVKDNSADRYREVNEVLQHHGIDTAQP